VPGVETLLGDRNGQLDALRGRRWDVVIDNTGFVPKYVRQSAELLAPEVGFCVFVSSIAVYASFATPNTERSPTGVLADPDEEKVREVDTYGPMKALCERYSGDAFPDRHCVVRPGYIVGPRDSTDGFTYWPVRASRGGEMLAPGTPEDPVQIIDVRDLAAWILLLSERRTTGVFNAISAPGALTMGDVVRASLATAPAAGTRVTWVGEELLPAKWIENRRVLLPWRPRRGAFAGEPFTATDRAVKAGLHIRPLAQTVRDTWSWYQTLSPEAAHRRPGMDPAEEAELLRSWHATHPTTGTV